MCVMYFHAEYKYHLVLNPSHTIFLTVIESRLFYWGNLFPQ